MMQVSGHLIKGEERAVCGLRDGLEYAQRATHRPIEGTEMRRRRSEGVWGKDMSPQEGHISVVVSLLGGHNGCKMSVQLT